MKHIKTYKLFEMLDIVSWDSIEETIKDISTDYQLEPFGDNYMGYLVTIPNEQENIPNLKQIVALYKTDYFELNKILKKYNLEVIDPDNDELTFEILDDDFQT
jgi:hypothetical protein